MSKPRCKDGTHLCAGCRWFAPLRPAAAADGRSGSIGNCHLDPEPYEVWDDHFCGRHSSVTDARVARVTDAVDRLTMGLDAIYSQLCDGSLQVYTKEGGR